MQGLLWLFKPRPPPYRVVPYAQRRSGEKRVANISAMRFPAVRPELPPPGAWLPFLDEAYAANWFTNFGALSRRLEARLAGDWGFAETSCVLAANATLALAAPLIACRIEGPVLLPAFTFPATSSAIKMAGAEPVLLDVSLETWRLSPETIAQALDTTGAKAAMLLAPFGLQTDFTGVIAAARARGAIVVIDNAAGLGVARGPVEHDPGVFEVYSLHATKPFGIGEGGAIFAHTSMEAHLRAALNFGQPHFGADGGPTWGMNGKMSEMQAAIGLAVAETFADRLGHRRAFAARLMALLRGVEGLVFPSDPAASAWQVFPVLGPNEAWAERAVALARERGLELRRYYRQALSLVTPGAPACPAAEALAARMICLPAYSRFAPGEEEALLDAVGGTLLKAAEEQER